MVGNYSSYYTILNIRKDASFNTIQKAFNLLTLKHHGENNNDSKKTNEYLLLIRNAYSVLSDQQKRKEYDQYLEKSCVISENSSLLQTRENDTAEILLSYINYILWEMEDYIASGVDLNTRIGSYSIRQYLLVMLTFLDKWILVPVGFSDYYLESRKMKKQDPTDFIVLLEKPTAFSNHLPYVNFQDYFYNIRKRIDRLLLKRECLDLSLRTGDVYLINSMMEFKNLSVHYLSILLKNDSTLISSIPSFQYTYSCYTL